MKSANIRFKNRSGLELAGRIDLPEDERPVAWAMFAHCFTCGKNLKSTSQISRALTREKIAVLRFDFTGLGNSEGDFSRSTLSSNVEDLLAAADWLKDNHQAPELLIGHSFGGAAVLQTVRHLPAVRAVATLAAPYDPRHVKHLFKDSIADIEQRGEAQVHVAGREFTIGREFITDLEDEHSRQRLENLAAALLVMHSPNDQIVDIENARLIYEAAKHPKSLISLDGADHLLTREADACYAGQMIATWAARYLDQDSKRSKDSHIIDNRVTVRTERGGFFTEVYANGHPMTADEPVDYGGTNRGPTPYDYLLVALGACTSMTIQMYAGNKNWPLESAVIRLTHRKIHAQDCATCETREGKLDYFDREVELIGDLDTNQRQRLLAIAERCPVHRTIHSELVVNTSLKTESAD